MGTGIYDISDFIESDVKNYFEAAKKALANSKALRDESEKLPEDSPLGLFALYISFEEVCKGVLYLFVHRGWMDELILSSKLLRKHDVKYAVYLEIFNSFEILDGQGYLDGKLVKDIDYLGLAEKYKIDYQQYMRDRNDCLYVDKKEKHWHYPYQIPNVQDIKQKIREKIDAIEGVYLVIEYYPHAKIMKKFKHSYYIDSDGKKIPKIEFLESKDHKLH